MKFGYDSNFDVKQDLIIVKIQLIGNLAKYSFRIYIFLNNLYISLSFWIVFLYL